MTGWQPVGHPFFLLLHSPLRRAHVEKPKRFRASEPSAYLAGAGGYSALLGHSCSQYGVSGRTWPSDGCICEGLRAWQRRDVADLSHHLVRLFRNGSGGRTNCVSDKPAYADGTADQRCYFCRSWCALARPVHLYASSSFGTWNVPRCFRSQISSSMRLGPSSRSLSKRHRALEAPILAGYCPC